MKSPFFACLPFLFCLLLSTSLSARQNVRWGDQGDGTYANPVLPADFSDLDAIRVGDDFYAISSTMQFSPGMAVLHSRDLVNWEIIGHVVDDLNRISPQMNWDRMNTYGKGIWAGSIRFYKGRYWVYFGTPDDGFFMSSARNPAGPWEPLHPVMKASGWDDCCSFLDDDGQLYFIATRFEPDPNTGKKYAIHLFRMTPDGKSLLPESDSIIHQSYGSEANKLYKIKGRYYHYFSEVKREGRVVMMERSSSLYGPWEIRQLNHVDRTKDKEPNQGGLIRLKDDSWWFFTHQGTGDWEGRAACLLPVTWVDGWPIVGQVGPDSIGNMVWSGPKPIRVKAKIRYKTSDEFNTSRLQPQWEWNYQPRADKWSLSDRKGWLRLQAFRPIHPENSSKILLRAGNTLTQRSLRTPSNTVTVKLCLKGMADGQHAGLTHFTTTSYSTVGIRQTDGVRNLVFGTIQQDSVVTRLKADVVWFQSTWDDQGKNRYSYSLDGKKFRHFGPVTQLTWGSYRGDRVGLFNYNNLKDTGYLDVDFFRYEFTRTTSAK